MAVSRLTIYYCCDVSIFKLFEFRLRCRCDLTWLHHNGERCFSSECHGEMFWVAVQQICEVQNLSTNLQ